MDLVTEIALLQLTGPGADKEVERLLHAHANATIRLSDVWTLRVQRAPSATFLASLWTVFQWHAYVDWYVFLGVIRRDSFSYACLLDSTGRVHITGQRPFDESGGRFFQMVTVAETLSDLVRDGPVKTIKAIDAIRSN